MGHYSENDRAFLERRRRLVASWPAVAAGLLAGIVGLGVWCWFEAPFLANADYIVEALTRGTVSRSQLETSALLVPVLFWMVLSVLILVICIGFAVTATEQRYLRILERRDRR